MLAFTSRTSPSSRRLPPREGDTIVFPFPKASKMQMYDVEDSDPIVTKAFEALEQFNPAFL